jgi:hypothetical protein
VAAPHTASPSVKAPIICAWDQPKARRIGSTKDEKL